MQQPDHSPALNPLSREEEVLRHQLNLTAYWAAKKETETARKEKKPVEIEGGLSSSGWNLLARLSLHSWQEECRERWFTEGGRGVVKVVTGAGKTVLACAIIDRLHQEQPGLRVAVVVPTVVLMDQWHEILSRDLPDSAVGRVGGGESDVFTEERRVLVCVLNSAAAKLPRMAEKLTEPLLLVVDECHRAGSSEMSKVFGTKRSYNLGLSATPEREDVPDDEDEESEEEEGLSFDESLLGQELGPIIYTLDYRQAIEAGILARFVIHHYGLPLSPRERNRYETMSREITDLRKRLQNQGGSRAAGLNGGALVGWARRVASRGESALARAASDYVRLTGERKQLVYRIESRKAAVEKIIREALDKDSSSRVILFHESIAEVMLLFYQLRKAGFSVVAEHSQLADSLRDESVRLFRQGNANVLVSARSLIEGFDVPAADVGIVVASSSSVRQRIQTLGRILRKKMNGAGTGEERNASLKVLYAAETVDENIYGKIDWESLTGAKRNCYFRWDPVSETPPQEQSGPPRKPKPKESEIDWSSLQPGDEYPGAYEGDEFSCDTQGNVKSSDGRLVVNPQNTTEMIQSARGSFGRFRVTPRQKAVLVAAGEPGSSYLVYAGRLEETFQLGGKSMDPRHQKGTPAPDGKSEQGTLLRVRQKAGRFVFSKKIQDGEAFSRCANNATDPTRGGETEQALLKIQELESELGLQIRQVIVTPAGEMFCEAKGHKYPIFNFKAGLEFADNTVVPS